MKDVARLAGVGVKTVSRVVNGEQYVSGRTRALVEKAIQELRFQRNDSAASLRQGYFKTVGLIVEDVEEPFQAALVKAVEQALFDRGLVLLTASSAHDPERERAILREFVARRVGGVILMPVARDNTYLDSELEAGLPIVFADRPPTGAIADLVASDNVAGARAAAAFLVSQGHRRIAYLGDDPVEFAGRERMLGYRTALKEASIPYSPNIVVVGDPSLDTSRAALVEMSKLDSPPTAVVTGNSLHTIALLRAPEFDRLTLDHVAFDDLELQDLFRRPLNAVVQNPMQIGLQATQLLLDRIRGESGPPREIRVPTELRVRSRS